MYLVDYRPSAYLMTTLWCHMFLFQHFVMFSTKLQRSEFILVNHPFICVHVCPSSMCKPIISMLLQAKMVNFQAQKLSFQKSYPHFFILNHPKIDILMTFVSFSRNNVETSDHSELIITDWIQCKFKQSGFPFSMVLLCTI